MKLIKRSWWKTTEIDISMEEMHQLFLGAPRLRPFRDFILKFMGYKMTPRPIPEQAQQEQPRPDPIREAEERIVRQEPQFRV